MATTPSAPLYRRCLTMPLSTFQPDRYHDLLQAKQQHLAELLQPFYQGPLAIHDSPPVGFRMRAEFRFWQDGDDGWYAMFPKGQPDSPQRIDNFPVAAAQINRLMQAVRDAVLQQPLLKQRLFQVEFLCSQKGEALVTLIYHRPLDDAWQAEATALASRLGCHIIGRSRRQKRVIGQDYIDETLQVMGRSLHYRQHEGSFTQPNAAVNEKMLAWACRQAGDSSGRDLLELYCGNGNFTVALADRFRRVLATEISKTSVQAARHNFVANGINNVQIARMSSEEFTIALNGERRFRRLDDEGIVLAEHDFSTVLVDPPRAGLDDGTLALLARFERIIYISCNPHTLVANLAQLAGSHQVLAAALFDQFPYTDHIETGVVLEKRN